jgi:uncharacterized delta-60 repeat protein
MKTLNLPRLSRTLLRLLAVALLGLLALPAFAAEGELDPTFGTGGVVTTAIGAGRCLTLQSDGKIVMAGASGTSFVTARYLSNGALDTDFGTGGSVVSDPVGGYFAGVAGVALQGDGGILVVGYAFGSTKTDFLVRYTASGALDTTFNGTGILTLPFSTSDSLAVAVQGDGKIVVAASGSGYAVARYLSTGAPDLDFGTAGVVDQNVGYFGNVRCMALQSDGKILVGGKAYSFSTGFGSALIRLNGDGSLDTGFSGSGLVSGSGEIDGVAQQADGKIVTTGGPTTARYNDDGSADTDFNGTGSVTTNLYTTTFGQSVALQTDGKIVVGGYFAHGGYRFAMLRYTSDGVLDNSFNGTGFATLDIGSSDQAFSVALQGDGQILLGGNSDNNFALVRYQGIPAAPVPPAVTIASVDGLSQTTATLHGTVNPKGSTTTAQFEYGTDTSYGSIATLTLLPDDGLTPQVVSAVLTGLTTHTLYHYRLSATNSFGTTQSGDATFTTQPVSAPELVVEQPAGTELQPTLTHVVAWGYNLQGQTTVPVEAQSDVRAISAGGFHSVALKNDGSVIAWGYNEHNETTVPVAAQSGVKAISAGAFHTAALKNDGGVIAWGSDSSSQATVPPAAQSDVTAISAGVSHTLALKSDGSVIAWGSNSSSQTTVPVAAQSSVTAISAGDIYSMALKSDGSVIAWGSDRSGKATVPAEALSGVTAIATGDNHALALKSDGSVIAWGDNGVGQATVPVAALSGVTAISAGYSLSVALKSDGSVVTWGDNGVGQATVSAAAQSGVTAVSANGYHVLAIVGMGSPVAFASQMAGTSSAAKSFTVRNSGTAALIVSSVSVTGGNVADFTVDTTGMLTSIPAGGQTSFSVTFAPVGIGARAATLRIASNDADENPFDIALTGTGFDATPPVISGVPANITAVATSPSGAVVTFLAPMANDAVDGSVAVVCVPASGSTFAVGTTTVTCTATDASGNSASASFTVTVVGESGVLSFASATPSFNPVNGSGQLNLLAVQINRTGVGTGVVTVDVVPSQPATVPGGFAKYVYGTDYEFVSGTSAGTTVSFAEGQMSAAVEVRLKMPALTKKGQFKLTMGTPTGDATNGAPTVALVTINTKDATRPMVTLTTAIPASVGASFDVIGKVKENDVLASFTVKLNGVAKTLETNPLTGFTANTDLDFKAAGLEPANGTNTLVIEAIDASGNKTTVTKTITYANQRPALAGTYNAVLSSAGTPAMATTGLITATVTTTGTFSGKVTVNGLAIAFSGLLDNDGVATFKPAYAPTFGVIDRSELDSYLGALAFSVTSPASMPTLTGGLYTDSSQGTTLAGGTGAVAYDRATAPSTDQTGSFNLAFPSKSQGPLDDPTSHPQGAAMVRATVTTTGAVTFAGFLPDGTKLSAASKLRRDNTVPLYAPLYRKLGDILGDLTFTPADNDDVRGTDLLWLRPTMLQAQYYPQGWPAGVRFDAVGVKYIHPAALNFTQGAANPMAGNATLAFVFGASTTTKTVSIDPTTGVVKIVASPGGNYTFSFAPKTGLFSGSFLHTDGRMTPYRGILLNKGTTHTGSGYFLSTPPVNVYGGSGQGGRVGLDPITGS